jgi:hypothetical protein
MARPRSTRPRFGGSGLLMVAALLTACAAPASPRGTPAASSPAPTPGSSTADAATPDAAAPSPWAEDLATLDKGVRMLHPGPFVVNPESAWTAKLEELGETLPTVADRDEQFALLASLVGLLDTHSWVGPSTPLHAYEVLLYRFPEGWFVVRAVDPTLVGSKLVSIGGVPAAEVEATLRPLLPSDNESGELDALEGPMSYVEYLHGAGIVDDPAAPGYVLERPDGSRVTLDPPVLEEPAWIEKYGIVGDLVGDAPEAVARRTEPIWTRLDPPTATFLISFNDYDRAGIDKAIEAMKDALDAGAANRVVLDMRYLRGGNFDGVETLVAALVDDTRVNRPGGLTVLIGRENVSAGTATAGSLDGGTQALLVGEETPARADNFLCPCHDITLPNSGFVVSVPTYSNYTGDDRPSIAPDVPMTLAAADFFAGRDPVLDAALEGIEGPGQ